VVDDEIGVLKFRVLAEWALIEVDIINRKHAHQSKHEKGLAGNPNDFLARLCKRASSLLPCGLT
jgi:hypothetical protein